MQTLSFLSVAPWSAGTVLWRVTHSPALDLPPSTLTFLSQAPESPG